MEVFRRAWVNEGLPEGLDEKIVSEVYATANDIVHQWCPTTNSVDPDHIVFELYDYVGDDDARAWALWRWSHCCRVYTSDSLTSYHLFFNV